MDKLKSLFAPGKATDDEILYGSGRSNDNVHSGNTGALTGEGSHFDNSRDTPGGLGLGSSNVGNAPNTAGPHSTDFANKVDPRVDSDLDGSRTVGNTTGDPSFSTRSNMPGTFDSDSNPYNTRELDPRLGGPTTTGGVGSNISSTFQNAPGQQTGYASQRPADTSGIHYGRDAAAVGTAGLVGEGIHNRRENERENLGTSTGTYGVNEGVGNTTSNTTTGPHSSDLLNRLDPRVDSSANRNVNDPNTESRYGRDAAAVAPEIYDDKSGYGNTGSNTTTGPHRSDILNKLDPRVDSTQYSGTTPSGTGSAYYGGPTGTAVSGVSGPHNTSTANRLDPTINQSGQSIEDSYIHDPQRGGGNVTADEAHGGGRHYLGRDAAIGAGGVGAAGLAEHEHRRHERERDTGVGRTTVTDSNTSGYGDESAYDNTTGGRGPHQSSLLNRLDPRVDSNTGEMRTTRTTGTETGTGHHYSRDAAVGAGGVGAVGLAEHEHRKHERERDYERDTGVGNTTGLGSGTGTYRDNSTYDNTTSARGPHQSSLLNKLDPRVDSKTGLMKDTQTGPEYGRETGYSDTTRPERHYGRDAAIGAGGVGAVGLAEHEHRKHEREREVEGRGTGTTAAAASGTGPAPNTAGPHSQDWMNKLDPRVDSRTGEVGTTGNTGTGTGPHYGRDAAIGAGGVGAAGLAEHEYRKREREREAGAGNTTGTGAYGDDTTYDNSTGTAAGPHSSSLLNKLDPRVDSNTGMMKESQTGHEFGRDTGYSDATRPQHHYGRDAAIGAGGVGAAGLAEHEYRKHENERDTELGRGTGAAAATTSATGPALNTAGPHSQDWMNRLDPRVDHNANTMTTTTGPEHHYGRDAAVGAGGVGAVGLAEHEHRKHEREREAGIGGTTGIGSNTGAYGNDPSYHNTTGTAAGPHQSSLLNKLDPRVDSNTGMMRDTNARTGPTTGNYRDDPRYTDTANTSGHHYGRDAAVGAGGVGAVGLAEHEHRKHEREREAGIGGTTGIGSNIGTYGNDPSYGSTTGTAAGPHKSSLLNKLDPRVDSNTGMMRDTDARTGPTTGNYRDDPRYTDTTNTSGHHYGRDAAVGAGGVGAVGLAEHEHRKHEREREAEGRGTGTAAAISTTGPAPNTAGPHSQDWMNRLDPRVDHNANTTTTIGPEHHYGRDAAIGAGGVGAAGLAEHEYRKRENERDAELGRGTGTAAAAASGTGPAPNTAGPHSQDWMNKLDPRVDSRTGEVGTIGNTGTGTGPHYGRDAAIGAGGVGAAGLAEHEHRKHERERGVGGTYNEGLPDFHHTGRDASATGAATGLDENEKARLRAARGERDGAYDQGPIEPGYSSTTTGRTTGSDPYDPGYNPNTTGPMHQQTRDHHLGRDVAAAGVVGGAAYEAEKHHRNTAADREQRHEVRQEEKEAQRESKEDKKHHGFLSFLHRDKNKKYTREEEDEFDRQEREHNSRLGRDTAIGGGAVVGGAAYEAERHHGHQHNLSEEPDTMKPLPIAPGNHGIGTGEGTQNALVMDRKRGEGYDTVPTGQPSTTTEDAYQAPGTTVGDKLHGIERNRGVNDGTTGVGYDTTTGTAGTTGTSDYAAGTAPRHNVLHKDPPPGHPAARAMAGQGNYSQDTTGSTNY